MGVVVHKMGFLWDNFTSGFIDYAMSAYDGFGVWKYPLLFFAMIGYVYGTMQSITVTIIAVLFTLGIYGATTNIFADVPDLTLFLYIVTIVGIALLITAIFIKRRG